MLPQGVASQSMLRIVNASTLYRQSFEEPGEGALYKVSIEVWET